MTRSSIVLSAAALALAGCAAHSTARQSTAQQSTAQRSTAQQRTAPVFGGESIRSIELPGVPGEGSPREVRVLVDEPSLKVLTIVLRAGTVLPEHVVPAPVTITALEGSGTVLAGGERLRLDATHAVSLAPGVPHEVEPDAETDLVLMVHQAHCGPGR